MINQHRVGSDASNRNEIPACCGDTLNETTRAISIKNLYPGDMLPTAQRRQITVNE